MFRQHLGQVIWFQPAKGGSAPPAPDPNVVSAAQTKSNQDTASYNAAMDRGSVFSPLGSQVFNQRGTDPTTGAPIWDQTISLNPDIQRLFDQQNQQNLALGNTAQGMLSQVDAAYNRPISTESLPALQGTLDTSGLPQLYGAEDLQGARTQAQDAVYNRQKAYLDPQWQQRETDLTTALANKGVLEGTEAWSKLRDQFGRERNFDYADARNAAITGGGDELSRLVGIAQGNRGQLMGERVTGANLSNQARGQGMQELFALRNQPLNEFNALRSATPVNMPQFSGPADTNLQGTDVAGNIWNAYNSSLDAWKQKQQNSNALLSGLFGLGSAYLGK